MILKQSLEELDDVIDRLYSINASISLNFIAMKRKPTEEEFRAINEIIGKNMKELRQRKSELNDKVAQKEVEVNVGDD